MARSNKRPDRKTAVGTGRQPSSGELTVHRPDGSQRPAKGKLAVRAPRASKRSQEVIKQVSIDRRDAIRELANR